MLHMIQQMRSSCDLMEQMIDKIQPENEWLSTKEFAQQAGLTHKTVSNYASRGDFRQARKNGKGQWEIHKSELS